MNMDFLRTASDKPVAPPPFTLSPVERTHDWRLYLWPFQSRKVLVSMVVLLSGGSLMTTLIVLLWLDHGALPWGLLGGLIGGMYIPYRVLPAKMTITTRSEARHHLADVQKLVLKIGGIPSGKVTETGHFHYCHKLRDKLGGWLSWTEQDIDLRVGAHTIEVKSTIAAVEWMHRQLANQLNA